MSDTESMGEATREKLKQFIARIERLESEKAELGADIREVYQELKSFGFDGKMVREVIRLRKLEAHERAEQEALLDMYMSAIDDGEIESVTVTKTLRMPGT